MVVQDFAVVLDDGFAVDLGRPGREAGWTLRGDGDWIAFRVPWGSPDLRENAGMLAPGPGTLGAFLATASARCGSGGRAREFCG
jgi:hypothetical protein